MGTEQLKPGASRSGLLLSLSLALLCVEESFHLNVMFK